MTQKQRFEYDRVIYEIGADSFMTQRGLIIEGNYRIGDRVLLVFDYKSRRYLPAFKREKPTMVEEEERRVKQPSTPRTPVKNMLVAFTKDAVDYVVLLDILDSKTWTATPVLASSINCSFGHLPFATCQMPFQCDTGLPDTRKVFQFSGNFYLLGPPYISNGFSAVGIAPPGSEGGFVHGIWDEKIGKAFRSASYQGGTIYPASSIPHGPLRIFGDKIWICNQIDTEYPDVERHYQFFRLSYDPDFGLTAEFEKHVPWYLRASGGYMGFSAYRDGRPKPFYINEDGEIFYKQVIFEELAVINVAIGTAINIYINSVHVSFTPTTNSKTDAAQGLAAAINSAFSGVVQAVAQDVFIRIITTNPEGIDVGVRHPDRVYLVFANQDSIAPLWSDQFRRWGWKLVILGGKEGDKISFSPTWQGCSTFPHVQIDAIDIYTYTIGHNETPQTIAQHLADDYNSTFEPGLVKHMIAASSGNVVTFTANSYYPSFRPAYPWLWSGEVFIVDYYPQTYLLRSYASKIKKIKDTTGGQVGDDIISDVFSFIATGSVFVLHYGVDNDIYWYLECEADLRAESFDELIDQTVKEELLYVGGSPKKTLFKTLDSKIQAHRSSSYARTGVLPPVPLVGGDYWTNLAFSDHLVETCQMEDLWNFVNQWQVDGNYHWHDLIEWAPDDPQFPIIWSWIETEWDDDFDATWQVDLKTREAKLINFPFTLDPKKPFYYRNVGDLRNNCSTLIDRHLVYHDEYHRFNPQIHTEQMTGDMNYQAGAIEIGTPYEKIFPTDGAGFYGGWIYIEDLANSIVVQGILLAKPGTRIIGTKEVPIFESVLYVDGRRIEEALATALGTTSDMILGMIYVPGIENDPNYQRFIGG